MDSDPCLLTRARWGSEPGMWVTSPLSSLRRVAPQENRCWGRVRTLLGGVRAEAEGPPPGGCEG